MLVTSVHSSLRDFLWNFAILNVDNNGAAVYVERTILCFNVHTTAKYLNSIFFY